jgi:hypothetical protein
LEERAEQEQQESDAHQAEQVRLEEEQEQWVPQGLEERAEQGTQEPPGEEPELQAQLVLQELEPE